MSEDAHELEAMVGRKNECRSERERKNECRSEREHMNERQSIQMSGGAYK